MSPPDKFNDAASVQDEKVLATSQTVEVGGGARHGTHRGLKPRHAQMMAIAGAIGTGLFVSMML